MQHNKNRHKINFYKIFITLYILFNFTGAFAKDLGKIGAVYPIVEEDLLQVLKHRAAQFLQSDALTAMDNTYHASIRAAMDKPQALDLTTTYSPRRFIYTPENFHVSTPIFTPLIFYNATDQRQVNWAKNKSQLYKDHVILILIGGSVVDQQKWHKNIYFDQGGIITGKLGIQHVPAIVTQEENHLLIKEEVP